MEIKCLSNTDGLLQLELTTVSSKKIIWEKWVNVPAKIRMLKKNQSVRIGDIDLCLLLDTNNLSVLFEDNIQSSTSLNHSIYRKFIDAIDSRYSPQLKTS